MLCQSLRVLRFSMRSDESMLRDGASFAHRLLVVESDRASRCRDVTDHLQLLLRKAGYHLHTSAEKEVVRMISAFASSSLSSKSAADADGHAEEKTCYVALSPAKEEKEAQAGGKSEDFRLPDGNVIRVRASPPFVSSRARLISARPNSSVPNGIARQKCSSTPRLSASSTRAYTRSSSTLSTARTSTCGKACSATSCLVVEERWSRVRRSVGASPRGARQAYAPRLPRIW